MESNERNFTVMWWTAEGKVAGAVGVQYMSDALDITREALGHHGTRDVTITRINRRMGVK